MNKNKSFKIKKAVYGFLFALVILSSNSTFAKNECSNSPMFRQLCPGPFSDLLEVVSCVRKNGAEFEKQPPDSSDHICYTKTTTVSRVCPFEILEGCGTKAHKDDYERCIFEESVKEGYEKCKNEIFKYLT